MSSRQEEKRRKREERLAAEQAERERKERMQRLYRIGGALLAVVALGVVIAAIAIGAGGGDDGDDHQQDNQGGTEPRAAETRGPIPPQQTTDLRAAARAAGCTLRTFESEGREHSENAAEWDFQTNPPTSGKHHPVPAVDGVYPFGKSPNIGQSVHSLEHGRINIQYGPGISQQQYEQLETLMAENQGYHQLLFRNQSQMPYAVAATAWTQQLGCKTFNPKVFDAIRTFRERYVDQAPEVVP